MYCTAFCTCPVALLLGGLSYSASCTGLQWLDTAMDLNKACENTCGLDDSFTLAIGEACIFLVFPKLAYRQNLHTLIKFFRSEVIV